MKVRHLDKDRALARSILRRQDKAFFEGRCRGMLHLACDYSAEAVTKYERVRWQRVAGALNDALAYTRGDRTMEAEA